MRVESREPTEPHRERLAVVPDSTEDLWHLQYVLEPGDHVSGQTTRRIQREEDHLRDTGGQRESMWVTLAVDEVEFHRFADRLRISGIIQECSREDQLGHHHTLNIEVHDELEVEKEFKPDQHERLTEAVKATDEPDVLVVTIEEGRAEFFELAQHGPQHRGSVAAGSGKRSGESLRKEFFSEIADRIQRTDVDAIVLAGPGFTKDDALKHLSDRAGEAPEHFRTVDTSAIGERGVHEVLQRGAIDEIRNETRIAREADIIDSILERLRENPALVAYGPEETATAAEYGAVEVLGIVDERLKRERIDGDWAIDIDGVLEAVEHQGGTVRVLSSDGEPGRQLDSLGGIAAILRYPIN